MRKEDSLSVSKQFNEGKACDAVIRGIEDREGAKRKNVRFPEQENHPAPVEVVCDIGGHKFAFEHTGIEPFHGHVLLQVTAPQHLMPIKTALASVLPPTEDFELQLPARGFENLERKQLKSVQAKIIDWIKKVALTLPIAERGRYVTPMQKVLIPGVPFEVSLHRRTTDGRREGLFKVAHIVDGSRIEENRTARIREGYNRKVPKLAAWQRDHGARTVLIFEDNDPQLTNAQLVADAVAIIEQGQAEVPDEIYLVETSLNALWWIWPLRIDAHDYYSLLSSKNAVKEINPVTLSNLTRR